MNIYWVKDVEDVDDHGYNRTCVDDTTFYAERSTAEAVAEQENRQEQSYHDKREEDRFRRWQKGQTEHDALVAAGLRQNRYLEFVRAEWEPRFRVEEIEVVG